jgi:hypothetical protein
LSSSAGGAVWRWSLAHGAFFAGCFGAGGRCGAFGAPGAGASIATDVRMFAARSVQTRHVRARAWRDAKRACMVGGDGTGWDIAGPA